MLRYEPEMSACKSIFSLRHRPCIRFPIDRLPGGVKRLSGFLHFVALAIRISIFAACLLFVLLAKADTSIQTTNDLVRFFKQAISSPPDIEKFMVSQQLIDGESISYYVGARAGSNFFLQILPNSNALANLSERRLVAGRFGNDAYQITQNAVNRGAGSNAMTAGAEPIFRLVQHFLDMGAANLKPGSVEWNGDAFTAVDNLFGGPSHGRLEFSNGLPFRLRMDYGEHSPLTRLVEYTYPNPATALSGFPAKMVISSGRERELKPFGVVLFYSVQLAPQPLREDFFAPDQFVGTNIVHTNEYVGADVYVQNRRGEKVKLPVSLAKSGGYTNTHSRAVILLCFALITLVPIIIFLRKKTNSK
jgi:hypothetical protein